MKKTGSDRVITFLRLLNIAAILSIATPCHVNITDFVDVRDTFKDFAKLHNAKVVNIWISGIKWANSSNESKEVFDPNWWSWATKDTTTLLEMAIDYKILSMGLLSIAVKDLKVDFFSVPPGCMEELDFSQQGRMVTAEILHLTEDRDINREGEDQLCRSVYSQRSLTSDHIVGVGKTCCTRNKLQTQSLDDQCCGKHAAKETEAFTSQSAVAVSIIGTVLPLMVIPLALAWWELHPVSAGQEFTKYLMNKLTKYTHFTLRGRGTRLDHETLIIKSNDLEAYYSPVSWTELLDIDLRVSTAKIKLTFVFLLQYVPIVSWLLCYSCMEETLHKLDTSEKILFNLRNIPLSWVFTDRSCWPFYIALVLICVNFFQIVLVIVWWLLEKQSFRLRFASLFYHLVGRLEQNCGTKLNIETIVQKTFTVFFVGLFIWSYISIYSLFHSVMYTIGGIIISVDIVSPWLTGGLLVLYYIQRAYGGMIDTYTEIKRLVFEVCRSKKVYKAKFICTRDVSSVDRNNRRIEEQNPKKTICFKPRQKCEGPVLFMFPAQKGSEEECMKIMISKEMLRQICHRVEPVKASILHACEKQFFTILFLFLVVFTTTVFRLHTATGEMSALVTSMATLLTALIPRLADMVATDAEGRLAGDVLRFKIESLLSIYQPKFDVIDTMNTPHDPSQFNPMQGTIDVIDISEENQDDDHDDFDGPLDELPTLTGASAQKLLLEDILQQLNSSNTRRRHGSHEKVSLQTNSGLATVPESSASEVWESAQTGTKKADSTDGRVFHKTRLQLTSPEDSPITTEQNNGLNSKEMTTLGDDEPVPSPIPERAVQVETNL